jgi:hypothetical protein
MNSAGLQANLDEVLPKELFNLDKPSSEEFLEVYKVKQFIKNF